MTIQISLKDMIDHASPMIYLDRRLYGENSKQVVGHISVGFDLACYKQRIDLSKPNTQENKEVDGVRVIEITQEEKYLFDKVA